MRFGTGLYVVIRGRVEGREAHGCMGITGLMHESRVFLGKRRAWADGRCIGFVLSVGARAWSKRWCEVCAVRRIGAGCICSGIVRAAGLCSELGRGFMLGGGLGQGLVWELCGVENMCGLRLAFAEALDEGLCGGLGGFREGLGGGLDMRGG
ncbi:hypothetical protein LIER_39385 [Lithospermum erythrorhizon]|uniref:Uncharacterized protein n=1 Tax=Lithospermum erythrorhizon TaxID=34254 RepID=A0AAV3QGQ0_LITER